MTDEQLLLQHHNLLRIIDIAITRYDTKHGKIKGRISRTQAYLTYGQHNVKYWVRTGLLTPTKGSAKNSIEWYEVAQLDTAKLTSSL